MGGVNNVDFATGSVQTTVVNLASGLTPAMPPGAKGAVITLDDGSSALRYRDDGTDPTTSVGHKLNPGDVITLDSWTVPKQDWRSVMRKMNFIQAVAASTGTLMVSYYD